MQVTLWVIFGGTVAMAAWVVRGRQPGQGTGQWGPTLAAGDVWVRLPAGWDVMPGDSADVLLQASEHAVAEPDAGDDGPDGRTLIVQQFVAPPHQTVGQFLASGVPLRNAVIVDGRSELTTTDAGLPSKPVQLGGVAGLMVETIRSVTPAPDQPSVRAHEWVACAIDPDAGVAIVARLQRFGSEPALPGAEADETLLTRVADAMRFRHAGR